MYGGQGADTITGGLAADTLNGDRGADVLSGGAGADTLTGGNGADTLTGDSGSDVFLFAAGSGPDVIVDFTAADGDRIALSSGVEYTIGANAAGDALITFLSEEVVLQGVRKELVSTDWFVFV